MTWCARRIVELVLAFPADNVIQEHAIWCMRNMAATGNGCESMMNSGALPVVLDALDNGAAIDAAWSTLARLAAHDGKRVTEARLRRLADATVSRDASHALRDLGFCGLMI